MHAAAAACARRAALGLDDDLLVRQMIEIFVTGRAALLCARALQGRIGLFQLGLDLGRRDLEFLERQRQLRLADAFRFAAEARAAHLGQDLLQSCLSGFQTRVEGGKLAVAGREFDVVGRKLGIADCQQFALADDRVALGDHGCMCRALDREQRMQRVDIGRQCGRARHVDDII